MNEWVGSCQAMPMCLLRDLLTGSSIPCPRLPQFPEHQRHGLPDPLVGVLDHLARRVADIPRGQQPLEFATGSLLFGPALHPQSQDLQLHDAEGTLDAQHQLVVQLAQVT